LCTYYQDLIRCSETCAVTYERITEVEDEDKNNALPAGIESINSVETKKRKRDLSQDLDLKRAFRRLTLMSKAPWLHLKEPVYRFEVPQNSQNGTDMDYSSGSDDDTLHSKESEPAFNDDLMIFDWLDHEETLLLNSIAINAPVNEEIALPPIQTAQSTHSAPNFSIRTGDIWTCVSTHPIKNSLAKSSIARVWRLRNDEVPRPLCQLRAWILPVLRYVWAWLLAWFLFDLSMLRVRPDGYLKPSDILE
jgi:hypothetical protein